MAFASMFIIFFLAVIIFILVSTTAAIILLISSHITKKKNQRLLQEAQAMGNFSYKPSSAPIVTKVIGIICLLPLIGTLALIIIGSVNTAVHHRTSLAYNISEMNVSRIQRLLKNNVPADCTMESNEPAEDGEDTILYDLADGYRIGDSDDDQTNEENAMKIMKILIDNGADVNYVRYHHSEDYDSHTDDLSDSAYYYSSDHCGETPLFAATRRGDLAMIKLLVENGADVNAVDYCGFNLINALADNVGDEKGCEILEYYLEKGVDPNHLTNYGQSAYWLAYRQSVGQSPLHNEKIQEKLFKLNEIS